MMIKSIQSHTSPKSYESQFRQLVVLAFAVLLVQSCNNQPSDTPFPFAKEPLRQPESQPLKLGEEKKLTWHTIKTGGIKPEIKKLDIDALPTQPYDSTGYKPILKEPDISHFNFSALSTSSFDLSKTASEPLSSRTVVMPLGAMIKSAALAQKAGTSIAISEMSAAQGLSDKHVLCVIKGRGGLMWIACEQGIYRYDGEYMQMFASVPAVALAEDREGRIWFINHTTIGVLDPRTSLLSSSNVIQAMNYTNVPKMTVDNNGLIWIPQTKAKGTVVIYPHDLTFKHLEEKSGIAGERVWSIYQDQKKNIWISGTAGVNIINPEKNKISHLTKTNGLENDTVRAITEGSHGDVWVACKNSGATAINIETGTLTNYGAAQGFVHLITYRLVYDEKGRIWMGTDHHSLAVIDPVKKLFKYFSDKDGLPGDYFVEVMQDDRNRVWVACYTHGLNIIEQGGEMVYPAGTKSLSALMEDAKGRIWIGAGTSNDGITILDLNKKTMRYLKKANGLSDDFIQAFLEVDNKVWFSTNGGGFEMIDPVRKTIEHVGKKQGLSSDSLYGFITDPHGNVWLTGPNLGLDVIDSAWQTIRHIGIADGLNDNDILDVKSDREGKIWIANHYKGVDIIDLNRGTIRNLRQGAGLSDTCYRFLMPDSSGRMWIATDKGLYLADIQNNKLVMLTTKDGLSNDYVNALNIYHGKVIAGTYNKISIVTPPLNYKVSDENPTTDTLWKIGLLEWSEGLVATGNAWAANIITTDGKYLWADAGLTIINGIREKTDNVPATYITTVKDMNEQLSFFNPIKLNEKDTIWKDDKPFTQDHGLPATGYVQQHEFKFDSVQGPYGLPVNLKIPYNQNYLQFQFAQANNGIKESVLYSYILEGIDKNWSTPANKTSTENYLSLPAGSYTFKARSKYVDGQWSESAGFSFEITPPWWKTWWAYTLLVLLIVGALRSFIAYRSRRLKKENRILEEKVALRTEQLQHSIEELKSTQTQLVQSEKMASLGELTAGIAHEIQNPLNFVNNFSEINKELVDELQQELKAGKIDDAIAISNDIRDNEEKINHHGKRADAIVKGMLQHSRASTNVKEPTNINALADEYLRLAFHGLRVKEKSFNAKLKTDFDNTIGNINIIPQDIGRVLLNLYNNAFYAVGEKLKAEGSMLNAGGEQGKEVTPFSGKVSPLFPVHPYEPLVSVSTKKTGNQVFITVSDNGNGIPQKVLDKIFQPFFTTKPTGQGTGLGLSLSYDIVKAHGGEIKVHTKENEGTEFIIQLPTA